MGGWVPQKRITAISGYGVMYILMNDVSGSLYAFVADSTFRVHGIRRYMPDEGAPTSMTCA